MAKAYYNPVRTIPTAPTQGEGMDRRKFIAGVVKNLTVMLDRHGDGYIGSFEIATTRL